MLGFEVHSETHDCWLGLSISLATQSTVSKTKRPEQVTQTTDATLQLGCVVFAASADGLSIDVQAADQNATASLDTRETAMLERFLTKHRQGEARSGFRVPFGPLITSLREEAKVTLVYRSIIYDVSLVDLSLTGALIRASTFAANRGAAVVLRIVLEDYLAKLPAEVVRADEQSVALHFTDCMRGGELSPPSELGPIFSRLERLFLKQRKT